MSAWIELFLGFLIGVLVSGIVHHFSDRLP